MSFQPVSVEETMPIGDNDDDENVDSEPLYRHRRYHDLYHRVCLVVQQWFITPSSRTRHHHGTTSSSSQPSFSFLLLFLSSPSITFWILGILNNSSYVIMLACAKSISEGGTGLVFLANVIPSMTIKLSAPYWFDKVHYTIRIQIASICMITSFIMIAILMNIHTTMNNNDDMTIQTTTTTTTTLTPSWILYGQLLAVALASLQCGLGEASLLALAGKYDSELQDNNNSNEYEDDCDDDDEMRINNNNNNPLQVHEQRRRHRTTTTTMMTTFQSSNTTASSNNNDTTTNTNKGTCLTCFASGTGLAGVFGFFWKWFWNDWLGYSLSTTLWIATVLAITYWIVYRYSLTEGSSSSMSSAVVVVNPQQQSCCPNSSSSPSSSSTTTPTVVVHTQRTLSTRSSSNSTGTSLMMSPIHNDRDDHQQHHNKNNINNHDEEDHEDDVEENETSPIVLVEHGKTRFTTIEPQYSSSLLATTTRTTTMSDEQDEFHDDDDGSSVVVEEVVVEEIPTMTTWERTQLMISLWPYMIPLFLVYAAEYALQAGTWTAIGFPSVHDRIGRNEFYEYSNWMYQIGVFISRSSGTLFTVPMWILWLMPGLQCFNVVLFGIIATVGTTDTTTTTDMIDSFASWAYHPGILYPLCVYVGLLGGGVYISGYKRICIDLPIPHREFALSTTSTAESFGIVLADIIGLFLQSCLYQYHHLNGAVVSCPISSGG